MEREIARLLPYILIGTFALGVLLFLLALYNLRLRRTGSYWRLRRRAGDRGGRLFLLSVGLMAASVVMALFSGLALLAYRNTVPTPTRGADDLYGIILSPTAPATEPAAAPEQTGTLVPPATDKPTPTPSHTPTLDLATLLNLPPTFEATPRPARAEARLSVDAVSDSPAAPAPELHAGIRRIYVTISFDHLDNGVAWSRELYRADSLVQASSSLWSLGESGSSSFVFEDPHGYPAGGYEVRLYLDDRETSRFPLILRAG